MSASPAVATAARHAKKPVDLNNRSCRRIDTTGSYFPKSECHTLAEWRDIDAENAANTAESRGHANGSYNLQR